MTSPKGHFPGVRIVYLMGQFDNQSVLDNDTGVGAKIDEKPRRDGICNAIVSGQPG